MKPKERRRCSSKIQKKSRCDVERTRHLHSKSDELSVNANLQYFLAAICDLETEFHDIHLGLRYHNTPEVNNLLCKIKHSRLSVDDITSTHPNVLFAVLKEMLGTMESPFPYEELLILSPASPEELVLLYISGLIDSLESDAAQICHLTCGSLHRLIELSDRPQRSLTDILIAFTPIMFPKCSSTSAFLRASRALLLMIEKPAAVFPPHLIAKGDHEDVIKEMVESFETCSTDSGIDLACTEEPLSDTEDSICLNDSAPYYYITFDV